MKAREIFRSQHESRLRKSLAVNVDDDSILADGSSSISGQTDIDSASSRQTVAAHRRTTLQDKLRGHVLSPSQKSPTSMTGASLSPSAHSPVNNGAGTSKELRRLSSVRDSPAKPKSVKRVFHAAHFAALIRAAEEKSSNGGGREGKDSRRTRKPSCEGLDDGDSTKSLMALRNETAISEEEGPVSKTVSSSDMKLRGSQRSSTSSRTSISKHKKASTSSVSSLSSPSRNDRSLSKKPSGHSPSRNRKTRKNSVSDNTTAHSPNARRPSMDRKTPTHSTSVSHHHTHHKQKKKKNKSVRYTAGPMPSHSLMGKKKWTGLSLVNSSLKSLSSAPGSTSEEVVNPYSVLGSNKKTLAQKETERMKEKQVMARQASRRELLALVSEASETSLSVRSARSRAPMTRRRKNSQVLLSIPKMGEFGGWSAPTSPARGAGTMLPVNLFNAQANHLEMLGCPRGEKLRELLTRKETSRKLTPLQRLRKVARKVVLKNMFAAWWCTGHWKDIIRRVAHTRTKRDVDALFRWIEKLNLSFFGTVSDMVRS